MTTLSAHGGGAQPASIDTSGKVTGGAALRVYGFDSEADAIAAGYVCEGGPAMSVALITDAQIASGAWKAEGDPNATAIYTAPATMPIEGGASVPVYAVNGWGSVTPLPSGPLILDLQSDQVGLSNGDPVSTWADQSGYGNDFTQTGTARPTFVALDDRNYPAVSFDNVNDWMLGPDFADNLDSFTVIVVSNGGPVRVTKMTQTSTGSGWAFYSRGGIGIIQEDGGNNWIEKDLNPYDTPFGAFLNTLQVVSKSEMHVYVNGDNSAEVDFSHAPVSDYSTAEPVRLAKFGSSLSYEDSLMYAIRIYSPALSNTARAAAEAELATRYGITL